MNDLDIPSFLRPENRGPREHSGQIAPLHPAFDRITDRVVNGRYWPFWHRIAVARLHGMACRAYVGQQLAEVRNRIVRYDMMGRAVRKAGR